MVFLTVGTTKFPFNRLLKAIDKVMISSEKKERLIVQMGTSDYQFKYLKTKVFSEIPFNKMITYLKTARVVITHGGPATIFLALYHNKNQPLVAPRYKKMGEHVDNHQVFFIKSLKGKELVRPIFFQKGAEKEITKYLQKPQKLSKKKNALSRKSLVKRLINYTECL